jgi:hypothetical protein
MIKWFTDLFSDRKKRYTRDVKRWAKTEYAKDWEYAFHAIMEGRRPYAD